MRQFLFALVILSTFAMAQNVLAIAPVAGTASDVMLPVAQSESIPTSEMPAPSTVGLLVIGLAGLTAAGGRRTPRHAHDA